MNPLMFPPDVRIQIRAEGYNELGAATFDFHWNDKLSARVKMSLPRSIKLKESDIITITALRPSDEVAILKTALTEFEEADPVKLLYLCATTMDDWSSWDNSIVRARANWLRRFASHLEEVRES